MNEDRLAAALRLATRGLAVFPCVPDAKRPLVAHGLYAATTDPATIRAWWTSWPEANLAIPTGRGSCDVVDVDIHPDGDGYPRLARLHAAGLLDGWTHQVRTPSGGLHIYFPGTDQRNGSIADAHIDFRATGGYVLVPPSTISTPAGAGHYVTVAANAGPGSPVDWEAIRRHVARADTGRVRNEWTARSASPDQMVGWLARYVARTPPGRRNQVLYWAACRAAQHAVRDPRPLLDAAQQAGLGQREAARTIQSAYRRIARGDQPGIGNASASRPAADRATSRVPPP